MATSRNLRKEDRKELNRPNIALLSYRKSDQQHANLFVNLQNFSVHGVLIQSQTDFNQNFELKLMIRNAELRQWDSFFCRVAWLQKQEFSKAFNIGLEFLFPVDISNDINKKIHNGLSPSDLDFILNTRLLNTLPKEGVCSFLNCMEQIAIQPGHRFITQGDQGDSLYIVQKGLCSIQIREENATLQTVAQRREGDVIGEMALLTGETRTASVISESNMILWKLPRESFDTACADYPDIREFLTELLTNRLENSTVTGVRNVGRYIMTHRIGQGGWSFVYKGRHKHLNMPVAIKMMKHNQAMDRDFLNNFRREGKLIAKLNHPNIVQIYDIEELYRTIFIIMECLEGESLETLLERKGGLPFSRALSFLIQVGSGLAYAHDKKIIHRDVKPANVFITNDDIIKLLDFGLACSPGEEDFDQTGTVHYMSPEQIEGDPVDSRSDIYSFGILAYEVFTGRKPFAGEDLMAVMKMHQNTLMPDPRDLVPDIPERIAGLIAKSCAKNKDQRYSSMHEVVEELTAISNSLKEGVFFSAEAQKQITVMLITHGKDQSLSLNRLLDEFSTMAQEKGFSLSVAGKTQLH
jgi:tRNA A-37 threonylcarbamoyl transferase component Bud32